MALGDEKALFDEAQKEGFDQARQAISSSGIPGMFNELREAERAAEEAKKHAKSLKARIARSLTNGIE